MPAEIPSLIRDGIFITLLLMASVTDIRRQIIPDSICVAIVMTSLIGFKPANLVGVFIALPFLIATIIFGGMGGGDIKLMAASGMLLGLNESIDAAIIGLTVTALFYIVSSIVQKLRGRKGQNHFPLAPFLSIGFISVLFLQMGGFY
jgi:leader peptidase (prepilin peptidase)/N-methyltransferase